MIKTIPRIEGHVTLHLTMQEAKALEAVLSDNKDLLPELTLLVNDIKQFFSLENHPG